MHLGRARRRHRFLSAAFHSAGAQWWMQVQGRLVDKDVFFNSSSAALVAAFAASSWRCPGSAPKEVLMQRAWITRPAQLTDQLQVPPFAGFNPAELPLHCHQAKIRQRQG